MKKNSQRIDSGEDNIEKLINDAINIQIPQIDVPGPMTKEELGRQNVDVGMEPEKKPLNLLRRLI